jgi:hypothetical protein
VSTRPSKVQEILTKYGCNIKVSLGLPDCSSNVCSENGLIILELLNAKSNKAFVNELKNLDNIKVEFIEM